MRLGKTLVMIALVSSVLAGATMIAADHAFMVAALAGSTYAYQPEFDPLDRRGTREAAWAGILSWSDRSQMLIRSAYALALAAPLCASAGAWRARHSWRRWPWLTLVAYAPAMVALSFALSAIYFEANRSWHLVATAAACLAACMIDLWRLRQPGAGRMLTWCLGVLCAVSTGLLAFAALRY